MNMQVLDEAGLILESVVRLLGQIPYLEIVSILSKIHGEEEDLASQDSCLLYNTWVKASLAGRKQIVREIELRLLEVVDRLLNQITLSDAGLVLARIHGNSANMTSETAWDLYSIWFKSSPNSRKIMASAIAKKIQGGSYRRELYKAWGESRSLPQDRLNELIQRIKR